MLKCRYKYGSALSSWSSQSGGRGIHVQLMTLKHAHYLLMVCIKCGGARADAQVTLPREVKGRGYHISAGI